MVRIVLRQTTTLIKKTYLLLLRKWFTTLLRSLLIPVGVMIFVSYAKYIYFPPQSYGFGSVQRIRTLKEAINYNPGKLVLIYNSNSTKQFANRLIENEGLEDVILLDDPDELQNICQTNLQGSSSCFAAVSFSTWADYWDGGIPSDSITENQLLYTMWLNPSQSQGKIDIKNSNSPIQSHVMPLQYAVDRAIAQDHLPSTPPKQWGYTKTTMEEQETLTNESYMRGVSQHLYPAFFIGMVGILNQLPGLFVTEREIGITSLMTAHGCSRTARYLSWHISLSALYLPGWLLGSAVIAVKLFRTSNPGIIIVFQILSGLSFASFALFLSTFFRRAQLASVFAVTLSMVLATVPVILTFDRGFTNSNPWIYVGLSAVFPPVNYISFLSCFAGWEAGSDRMNLLKNRNEVVHDGYYPIGGPAATKGIVYWAFAFAHIILFPILAAVVENWIFSVKTGGRRVALETSGAVDGAPLGIRVSNFTKTYGKVKAVDDLSLKVYQGQIMCLLGANGSGKTTTLQAIAGMGSITDGKIEIAGLKRKSNSTASGVGICPQGNALWDSLTVEEHVELWAKIKCSSNTKIDDGEIISECDLWKKKAARAGTLSGGMKRKLQLAIMLVGGSTVCCLDEATSGLDPLSRLKIHEIILANRGKRTMLFTTHFLDEADALSDYIAIISKGKSQARGTSAFLKARHANGYKITTTSPVNGQTEWVVATAADVTPTLREIEANGAKDYKVEGPTLEDVFLNTVADAESAEAGIERKLNDDLSTDTSLSDANPLNLSSSTVSNFWREMMAIYVKRWMIIQRSFVPVLATILIPIGVAIATRSLTTDYQLNRCARTNNSFKKRQLFGGNQWDQGYLIDYLNSSMLLAPSNYWRASPERLSAADALLSQVPKNFAPDLESFMNQVENGYSDIPIALFRNATDGSEDIIGLNMELPVDYSGYALQYMNQLRINDTGGDMVLNPIVQFFENSGPALQGLGWALIFIFFFGFAMALAASFATLYPTRERVSKVRALHYSNGVRPAPLWVGHLLYESVFLIGAGIACAVIFSKNEPDNRYHPLFLVLVFILYGIAACLLSFVVSLFAKSSLAAFPVMAGINSITHTVTLVVCMALYAVGRADKLVSNINASWYGLGFFFPIANVDRALFLSLNMFSIACNPATAASGWSPGLRKSPFAFDLYGGPAFYLILQSCFYYAFLVWWESGRPLPQFLYKSPLLRKIPYISKIMRAPVSDSTQSPQGAAAAAATLHDEEKSLIVQNVTKTFGRNIAVDNVSFAVSYNETFCLLGPNGAGKTTTLTMILGELAPDSGDIFVSGHSVSHQRSLARASLGVCPQFDAIDNLTVTQTLSFYAAVKGVANVQHNVMEVVRAVGLEHFVRRKAEELSGGNKRKLSLAIALLGNPPVMLLDEPSSGMDAAAKRVMWRTLRSVSTGRAIVLTTHSMEESDALADRVGILGGKMLALGTIPELKAQYGDFHHIHLVAASAPHSTDSEMATIEAFVAESFGVRAGRGVLGQLKLRVPANRWRVGEVFRALQRAEEVGVGDFSVTVTSLEDVFLEVSKRYEESLANEERVGV